MLPTRVPLVLSSECSFFKREEGSYYQTFEDYRHILLIPIYFLLTSPNYTSYSFNVVAPAMPLHPGSKIHFRLLPLHICANMISFQMITRILSFFLRFYAMAIHGIDLFVSPLPFAVSKYHQSLRDRLSTDD